MAYVILILRACEIARDRDCDLGQLTDRVWLSSGQRIRKTNHYPHNPDLRENDWEVDYYLRMRRAASPRAKVGRRGPRALLDARAAIHIIYVIYIKGRRGRVHPLIELCYLPSRCERSRVTTEVSLSGNDAKDQGPWSSEETNSPRGQPNLLHEMSDMEMYRVGVWPSGWGRLYPAVPG